MASYQKNLFEAKDSISTELMSKENEELQNEYIFIQCACCKVIRMTIKELLMLFFKLIVIIIIHAIIVPTLVAKDSL